MTIIDVSKLVEGPVQEDNPFQVNQHHFSSDAQLENFLLSSQYFWSLMVQRIEDDLCRHLLLMLCWESRKISYKVGCTLKGLSFYFHVVQLNFQENKRERERERQRGYWLCWSWREMHILYAHFELYPSLQCQGFIVPHSAP